MSVRLKTDSAVVWSDATHVTIAIPIVGELSDVWLAHFGAVPGGGSIEDDAASGGPVTLQFKLPLPASDEDVVAALDRVQHHIREVEQATAAAVADAARVSRVIASWGGDLGSRGHG